MRQFGVIAAAIFLSGGAASAAVQIKVPACDAVTTWSARVNPQDMYNVAPRLTLPKAFDDTTLVPVFGVPVLSWTQEDVQAVSAGLVACYNDAGKRRDAAAAGALANANRALMGLVPRTNAALQKAKTDADAAKQQIDAVPDSPELGQAIDVLLHQNPAQPDQNAYRPFARPIVDPIWRMQMAVLNLADADRAPIYKALGEREAKMQANLSGDADKAIGSASNDAAGVIAMMQARQKAAQIADPETKAKLTKAADDKAQEIRAALRQAKPPVWVPPSCLDLYRWSSAPGFNQGVAMAGHTIWMAFVDERVVPVFGISTGDWSDADVASFKTLRALCQAASQPAMAATGGPEAAELVQTANRGGRWIEGGDQQIADARASIAAYRKVQEAMNADIAKIQALPDAATSIMGIAQITTDPALGGLTQDDRNKVINVINAKRTAIAAKATDAAIKGLADVKLASLGDMKNLFAYVAQTMPTIPDPRGQQAFRDAFNQTLQQATTKLVPEFKAKLASTPATLSGVAEANLILLQLNTASYQAMNTPAYQIYAKAMEESRDAQAKSARDHACADYGSSLSLGSDAAQTVWEGHDTATLGEFVCEVGEHGMVNSYSGAGMFSSTSTLKVTPLKSQTYTISMHTVEVQAGKPMLVGFEIKDSAQASGQASAPAGQPGYSPTPNGPVTVEGWEIFVPDIIGINGSESEECKKTIENPSPDSLAPQAKLFWLHCWTLADVLSHVQNAHFPQRQ